MLQLISILSSSAHANPMFSAVHLASTAPSCSEFWLYDSLRSFLRLSLMSLQAAALWFDHTGAQGFEGPNISLRSLWRAN